MDVLNLNAMTGINVHKGKTILNKVDLLVLMDKHLYWGF
jgi:hypothetical protein